MRHVACVLSFLLVALCPSELWLPTFADLVPGGDPFDVAADGEQVIVASNLRGDTVIVWVEEGAPRYQLFDSGGALRGVVRTILTEGECTAFSPAVAMDASGNFVIAFMCQVFFPGVPPAPGLLARRFDADGDPLGEEFRPFTTLAASGWPAVSMTATGDFVVAATGVDVDGRAILLRAFSHAGEPMGETQRVDSTTVPFRHRAWVSLAMDPQGGGFVAWGSYACATDSCLDFRIHGRRFDTSGQVEGEVIAITEDGLGVDVAWHPDQGFLAVWHRPVPNDFFFGNPAEFSVQGRALTQVGLGPEFAIKEEVDGRLEMHAPRPALAVDAQGHAVVAWQDSVASEAPEEIFVQALDAALTLDGDRLRVHRWEGSGNLAPSLAAQGSRSFALAWEEKGLDASLPRAQRFRNVEGGCSADLTHLCLQQGRFEVTGTFRLPGGESTAASFVALSDDSGVFWFSRSNNLEGLVKVLDGRAINDHYWVFSGGLSNLEYSLQVRDTLTDSVRPYDNPAGEFAAFGDTGAFRSPLPPGAGAPVILARAEALRPEEEPLLTVLEGEARDLGGAAAAAHAACQPGPWRLCLLEGRFQVEVMQFFPDSDPPLPVLGAFLTDQSGVFWFGQPGNLELIVKLHDGRPANGHFWVFWGGATNQNFRLFVTDTETGDSWSFNHEGGSFTADADTAAF